MLFFYKTENKATTFIKVNEWLNRCGVLEVFSTQINLNLKNLITKLLTRTLLRLNDEKKVTNSS